MSILYQKSREVNSFAEEFESIKQFDSALKTPDGSCLKHPTGVNYMTSRSAVKHSKITWLRYARAKAAMTIKISSVMIVQKEIVVEIYSS